MQFNKITDYLWEIPKSFRKDMRVPSRVFATEKMLAEMQKDRSLEQLINVATLPGIQKWALAMPDAHEGYGFPVGGVAAFSVEDGIISPGGIGYDINCGVRLLRSQLSAHDLRPNLEKLGATLYREIPSGVGRGGRIKLKSREMDQVLKNGAREMLKAGYAEPQDLEQIESGGCLSEADSELVSDRAKDRGRDQLGTIGAGNHFVEVQEVDEVFKNSPSAGRTVLNGEAGKFGLCKGQVVVMIHTGSRGLGHQIATDYIRLMMKVMSKYGIEIPDRELACAPFFSPEGQNYFRAMSAGANFAWANRQLITWEVRKAWESVLGKSQIGANGESLEVVYDVAHNMAKIEKHIVPSPSPLPKGEGDRADARSGEGQTMIVHRKGATRAFPGQPVLIPGSMGTVSYVLEGLPTAMELSFGSSCHGAGRRMSRKQAKREIRGSELKDALRGQGIVVNAGSLSGLAEEAPEAYKDVEEVVEVVARAGLAKKVARLRPLAVIKG